ncbi:EF hand domain-containing protein, partial [Cryptosporidium felis]
VNVQKLKYIFTFATRNLRTPDIETALRDIHSLAYKVFDAQVALLVPIFGRRNVLTFGSAGPHSLLAQEEAWLGGAGPGAFERQATSSSVGNGLSGKNFTFSSSWQLGNSSSSNLNGGAQSRAPAGAGGVLELESDDTTKFLQLMRILHNEVRQDIWIMFSHIIARLFDRNRIKKGADHFLDVVYPKLIRRKAARIVNIFYGPSLNELSACIHDYFVSEYRVENQRNVRETLEIISLSQGNASLQFQVSLITKALYALSVLKDSDVEMLTVDIPWKRSHTLITEEVLILPRNHQGMKVILGAIQTVLRRATSITSSRSSAGGGGGAQQGGDGRKEEGSELLRGRTEAESSVQVFQQALMDSRLSEINGISSTGGGAGSSGSAVNEFSETTLEQVIQVIVSQYLWMDAFVFLIRLCGVNLSTDRLPSVTYDNSVSLTNLNYIEERNLQHVKSVFTKLSNGSGFLPVELSDLALQTLTDRCLNFPGLLVSMHFLGLISSNMLLMGSGSPLERLGELGFTQNTSVFHIHQNSSF